MTAADFAGVVRFALTPATSPFPLTTGYYQTPAVTEIVRGVIHQRRKDPPLEAGLDDETAVLTMDKALFQTIAEWTPDDRFKVPGEVAWQVRGATEHEAHLTLTLGRRLQRENELVADPQSILGDRLVMWLDASDAGTITDDANGISAWRNKALLAGAVAAVTQSVNANKPTRATAPNGLGAVDFAPGGPAFLRSVAPVTAAPFQVFAVTRVDDSLVGRAVLALSQGILLTEEWRLNVAGGSALVWAATAGGSSSGPTTTTTITTGALFLANARELAINNREIELDGGGLGVNATPLTPSGINVLTLGARGDDSLPHDGLIGEVVFATGVIAAAELAQLETYSERWGLTIP